MHKFEAVLPWDEPEPRPQMLSQAETADLERALQDGFQIHGSMMPGEKYRLDGLVDEPFFGASAGSSSEAPAVVPEFVSKLRSEGLSEEEVLDEFRDFLDSHVSDDAPEWGATNPFGFSFSALEAFFKKQLCTYWGIPVEDYSPDLTDSIIDAYLPFCRTWFEVRILHEIAYFDYSFQDFERFEAQANRSPGATFGRKFSLWQAFASAGKIGRMVEHYRWRFSYGRDALRGRASVLAARMGGQERAKRLNAKSKGVLSAMAVYRERGHSIQNAARLAFKDGIGSSESANAKLWHRRALK
jgi:hypothetical protein